MDKQYVGRLGNVSAATEPARESQINGEMAVLGAQLDDLQSIANNLEQRLCNVLTSVPPTGNGQSVPEPVLVPLASRIKEKSNGVRILSAQLQSIIDRLEV